MAEIDLDIWWLNHPHARPLTVDTELSADQKLRADLGNIRCNELKHPASHPETDFAQRGVWTRGSLSPKPRSPLDWTDILKGLRGMARRRGFFAEIQHQAKLAEKQRMAAQRQQQSAARRAEQNRRTAEREAERTRVQAQRAAEQDRKQLEREAAAAYVVAKLAEVEVLNAALADQYTELDGLLAATLDVDDFVDMESFRVTVDHPAFEREDLRAPTPLPTPIAEPGPPVRVEPPSPGGLFGRKKKLAAAQEEADARYAADYQRWQSYMASVPAMRARQKEGYAAAEAKREEVLARELARYEKECAVREREVQERNAELDELIAGLGYGTVDAVQEYVGIVLANSVYPDSFPVTHTAEFEPSAAELRLQVVVPGPDTVPTIKAYKYTKTSDEITSTNLAQKDIKERYASIVHAVTLRSLHEVFEADRRNLIRAISLELGTKTIDPATGRDTYIPFVAVAAERERFEEIDLSAVVPAATLEYLGAAVSKNPNWLVPISATGVRRA